MAAEDRPGEEPLNLKQVAHRLGVHYMTAYRYVRQGRLPARQEGTAWLVEARDVEAFEHAPRAYAERGVDWASRFRRELLEGSEAGAWLVVDQALAAAQTPQQCYLDLVSGSMAVIGEEVEAGVLTIADQYVAAAIAQRIVARLGTRFRRRGRSRGTVVLGAPTGERHALPIAIVADLVRLAGFAVLELGADVPPEAFALAALRAPRLVAVGIGVTTVDRLDAATAVVAAVRAAAPDVPIILGGQAIRSPEIASLVGVTEWAPDGASVVEAIEVLARRPARAAVV